MTTTYQTAGRCIDCGGKVTIQADPSMVDHIRTMDEATIRRKLADAWTWGNGREDLIAGMEQRISQQAAEIAALRAEVAGRPSPGDDGEIERLQAALAEQQRVNAGLMQRTGERELQLMGRIRELEGRFQAVEESRRLLHQELDAARQMELTYHTCACCGGAVHGLEPHKVYCSAACKQKAYRQRKGKDVTAA